MLYVIYVYRLHVDMLIAAFIIPYLYLYIERTWFLATTPYTDDKVINSSS